MSAVVDDQDLSQAPWWIRLLYQVGLPTAFAVVLLYVFINNVIVTLEEMKSEHQTQTRITRVICANTAKTDISAQECWK